MLGMTVGELEERMSAYEFQEWIVELSQRAQEQKLAQDKARFKASVRGGR